MSAVILNIQARNKAIETVCNLSDFTVTEGDTISPESIAANANLHPYCLDDANRRAIFVEVPPSIDLAEVSFYNQTLFEKAQRLIAVDYETFHQMAAAASIRPVSMIIIHTIGRSGSTLFDDIFYQGESAVSLSEPDIFVSGLDFRQKDSSRDLEIVQLMRSSLNLTFKPLAVDGVTTFSFKLRNQGIELIDLLYKAFPEAHHIFLYRSAVGFAASFYRIFRKMGLTQDVSRDEVVKLVYDHIRRESDEVEPYLVDKPYVTQVENIALLWLLFMDRALKFYKQGIPLLGLRYEDLNSKRSETLAALFEYCHLSSDQLPAALKAFEHDAQEGTILARDNPQKGNSTTLTAEQIAQIQAILDKHPIIRTPDYILPGTLQV